MKVKFQTSILLSGSLFFVKTDYALYTFQFVFQLCNPGKGVLIALLGLRKFLVRLRKLLIRLRKLLVRLRKLLRSLL